MYRARGARKAFGRPAYAGVCGSEGSELGVAALLISLRPAPSISAKQLFHGPTLMTHVAGVKAGSKTMRGLLKDSTLLGTLIASLRQDRKLLLTNAPATVSLLQRPLWVRSGALAKGERRGETRPLGGLLSPLIEASIGTSDSHTYRLFASGGTCSLGELWPRSAG